MNKTIVSIVILMMIVSAATLWIRYSVKSARNITMGDPANTMDIPANTFVSPDGRFSFRYPEFKGWTHSFFLSPAQNLHLTITFHPVKLTPDDIAPQIYLTGDGIDDSRLVAGSDGYDKKAVSSFLENRAIYII